MKTTQDIYPIHKGTHVVFTFMLEEGFTPDWYKPFYFKGRLGVLKTDAVCKYKEPKNSIDLST